MFLYFLTIKLAKKNLFTDEFILGVLAAMLTQAKSLIFRFGFKIWVLSSSDGSLLACEPYCGNSTQIPKVLNNQGPDVVLGLLAKANISRGSQVFFDNLFTSMPLLDILSSKGKNLIYVACYFHFLLF